MWKISGIFTLHHTVLRCTECLSTLTETGGARITIAVPPFSILIYLTAILTGAGVTCTQLPGVSLIVASIAHCASMSAWRQARGAAFSLQHIELVTVTPNWWTAVSVT
jgi:hypothetical protein